MATVRFLFLLKNATGIEVLSHGLEKIPAIPDACKQFTKLA